MYARIESGAVAKYPFTQEDLRALYPEASLPAVWTPEFMASEGVVLVVATGQPAHSNTETVEEATPVYSASRDRWEQQWSVRAATAEEVAARNAVLLKAIVIETQARLDTFARTRGYDGILSACTYANSPTVKFAAEGLYCVAQRDATWAKLYEMLAEVEAGTRPVPSGYADIEPELPSLAWPV